MLPLSLKPKLKTLSVKKNLDILLLLTNPIAYLPFLQASEATLNDVLKIAQLLNRPIDRVVGLNKKSKRLPHWIKSIPLRQ